MTFEGMLAKERPRISSPGQTDYSAASRFIRFMPYTRSIIAVSV
jgi:hypothetical protein